MVNDRKVLVIGLDSAPPELLFEKFKEELPNLSSLIDNGYYGKMKSSHPPITIPAWMVMVTGRDPGMLGIYGFRHRKPGSYNDFYIVNSKFIKEKKIWDLLGEVDKRSCLIGIPPSYPPQRINGCLISCFITPSTKRSYTYPNGLRKEVEALVGEYEFDVTFRVENRDKVKEDLFRMTEKRFKIINHLIENKKWDFFMFVEIGLDRLHHAFWKFFDEGHHLYEPGNKYEDVIPNYYKLLDEKIGELMDKLDEDTYVIVVSDHGVKRMKGAFVTNEWLIDEGYLTLNKEPDKVISIDQADVNWSKTIAWGWGGYYARVFINIEGREKQGVVKKQDLDDVVDQLIYDIKKIKDPEGRPMNNIVYKPKELYSDLKGDPPDLMVYFDDLYWRSAGTLGYNSYYLPENDTGPDDAVHSQHGVFVLSDPQGTIPHRYIDEIDILDIAPTILALYNLKKDNGMIGRNILGD
jgi:predicted AlkP superfamily phosphohydrolase/phosphomutase